MAGRKKSVQVLDVHVNMFLRLWAYVDELKCGKQPPQVCAWTLYPDVH